MKKSNYTLEIPRDIRSIANETMFELLNATSKFGAFASTHEGIAVLREEYLELEQEVFKNQKNYDIEKMRKEAIQIAAMGMRFVLDCCDK